MNRSVKDWLFYSSPALLMFCASMGVSIHMDRLGYGHPEWEFASEIYAAGIVGGFGLMFLVSIYLIGTRWIIPHYKRWEATKMVAQYQKLKQSGALTESQYSALVKKIGSDLTT